MSDLAAPIGGQDASRPDQRRNNRFRHWRIHPWVAVADRHTLGDEEMKLETILNALERSLYYCDFPETSKVLAISARQARAFRARMLRMDAEKDAEIWRLQDIIFRKTKIGGHR